MQSQNFYVVSQCLSTGMLNVVVLDVSCLYQMLCDNFAFAKAVWVVPYGSMVSLTVR